VRLRRLAGLWAISAAFAAAPPAGAVKPYDLNGDGRQDLVVGLPNWEDARGEEVGALLALGSKRGMVGDPRIITRRALGIPPAGWRASLGTSVASADFDGDGRADLALGAPTLGEYEQPEYEPRGAVAVAYGARRFPGSTELIREPEGESPPFFGSYLVAGDVRRDGFADLVLGPGGFYVLPGGKRGVAQTGAFTIAPPPGDPASASETHRLALGDTTGNRQVEVFEASEGKQTYDEPKAPGYIEGVFDAAKQAEWVEEKMPSGGPRSLAIGDVDGDGYRDLVAGVPNNYSTEFGEPGPPGAVMIWWGGPKRLSENPTIITQGSAGIPGTNEGEDAFGWSVAVGNLDADRYADIVVGNPYEDELPDFSGSRGRVTTIRGGPYGYSRKGNRSFGFDTRGFPGSVKRGDRYLGFTTSLLDLNGDRRLDAAISDPRGVTLLQGTRRGLSLKRASRLTYSRSGATTGTGATGPNADHPRIGRPGSSG
jgi:FG-GAP repeat